MGEPRERVRGMMVEVSGFCGGWEGGKGRGEGRKLVLTGDVENDTAGWETTGGEFRALVRRESVANGCAGTRLIVIMKNALGRRQGICWQGVVDLVRWPGYH